MTTKANDPVIAGKVAKIETVDVSYKDVDMDPVNNDRVHSSEELVKGVSVNTYAISALEDQILVVEGQILERVHLERVTEGRKTHLVTRRGNRRMYSVKNLAALDDKSLWARYRAAKLGFDVDANIPEEPNKDVLKTIRANFEKIPAVIHSGLTEVERDRLVHDKDQKGMTRTDLVKAVHKLMRSGYKEADISVKLYIQLAMYSGNQNKLNQLPEDPAERNKFVKSWFHGLVGAYFMSVIKEGGERGIRLMYLTHMLEDGLIHREKRNKDNQVVQVASPVLPEFKLTHNRWNKIKQAKAQDVKNKIVTEDSDIWESPAVKELINGPSGYVAQDAGTAAPTAPDNRLKVKDLDGLGAKSTLYKRAINVFKGVQDEGLPELDDRTHNIELKLQLIEANLDSVVSDEVKMILGSLTSKDPASKFEEKLRSLFAKPKKAAVKA